MQEKHPGSRSKKKKTPPPTRSRLRTTETTKLCDTLHLRKLNRIMSIHASTAIKGNCLTLKQVSDVINGKPVRGPKKGIKEVQNAWQAYNAKWNPLFAWMPVETLVHHNQALYYKSLQNSHIGTVDCRPFIDFMLNAIGNSLYKYFEITTQTTVDVPVNDPVNVPANGVSDKILIIVRANHRATAQKMALARGVTEKTIKRHLKALREQGKLQRIGSDKTGYWKVLEKSTE